MVVPGAFHTTVGLLSLGAIGRMVAQRLKNHDVRVVAHDPYVDPEQAAELGVELVSLERLFVDSDVVSIHAPNLPATRGMVSGELIRSMKPDASLINTARGQVIDEPALIEALRERDDLDAILDVAANEPDNADSPLWDLPNVILTPHIARSMDKECRRMGEYMVEEWERYRTGQALEHEVTEALLKTMA
jgi:phosphoglycerate dehydrogenase-like enzyme